MDKQITIRQGDVSRVIRPRPVIDGDEPAFVLDSDWHCQTVLLNPDGSQVFEPRNVTDKTDDGERFIVALHPAETRDLEPTDGYSETYTWVIEIWNDTTTPPFSKEAHYPVKVLKQGLRR